MTNENEALRRSDDAMRRIEALEEQLERAIRRINALEALVLTSSAELANLGITLANPSRERLDPLATRHQRPPVERP